MSDKRFGSLEFGDELEALLRRLDVPFQGAVACQPDVASDVEPAADEPTDAPSTVVDDTFPVGDTADSEADAPLASGYYRVSGRTAGEPIRKLLGTETAKSFGVVMFWCVCMALWLRYPPSPGSSWWTCSYDGVPVFRWVQGFLIIGVMMSAGHTAVQTRAILAAAALCQALCGIVIALASGGGIPDKPKPIDCFFLFGCIGACLSVRHLVAACFASPGRVYANGATVVAAVQGLFRTDGPSDAYIISLSAPTEGVDAEGWRDLADGQQGRLCFTPDGVFMSFRATKPRA